jgi:hypothetical protein
MAPERECSMNMRFAMPLVPGRGAGLGNEMIVWGKAYIASQILNARLLHPAWGLNERRYDRYFGTSRLDWIYQRALRSALPVETFSEADYLRLGGGELEGTLEAFARERELDKRSTYVLGLSGLWGGLGILRGARNFLRTQLLGARGTLNNLYKVDSRFVPDRLRIALHVRRGDFATPIPLDGYRGTFNTAIQLDWYIAVAQSIMASLESEVQFLVVSDASADELEPLTRSVPCVTTFDLPDRDISDMLALADSDFILCSISSFSLWSVFLSNARYGWFAPNLTVQSGLGTIWGHEPLQREESSASSIALSEIRELLDANRPVRERGVAIGPDGIVPNELLEYLIGQHAVKRRATDLLRFGATRMTPQL